MPRTRRVWVPGQPTHVISRFVDRRFHLVDDEDRRFFLQSMGLAMKRWDWEMLSYALMSSHVHYGTLAGAVDPDRFFRSTHTRFACRFHRRHAPETLGPVFAGRPALHVVQRIKRARMVAYHHRNPVAAGVVALPRESRWTSHRAYLRLDPAPEWLNVSRALAFIGFDDTESGRKLFDEFVIESDFTSASAADLGGGYEQEHGCVFTAPPPAVCWSAVEGAARTITGLAEDVPMHSATRRAALTRRLIATVTTVHMGQTQGAVADQFGMHPGSVANLVSRGRGDARLTALVQQLLVALEGC